MENINFTYNENGKLLVNYKLNENKTFKEYQLFPFDESLPYLEFDNLDEVRKIKVGITKLVNSEIIQPEPPQPTNKELKEKAITSFRGFRTWVFKNGFDIWEKAVLRGREEDSEDIMNWYQDMLDFPELITKDTTHEDYPEVPQEIKYYLGVE